MSLVNLTVMYGHLEGAGGDFARDPTGYLSIEAEIFRKHGLDIFWQHVQGTKNGIKTRKWLGTNLPVGRTRFVATFSNVKNDAHLRRGDE